MSLKDVHNESRAGHNFRTAAGRASLLAFPRPALAAAGIGLLLSLMAAYVVCRWENWAAKLEFAGVARNQAIILQNGVNEYLNRLTALRTLFESTNEVVTRSEFEVFTTRLFEEHPGILWVSWAPRVRGKERAEYEQAAIRDGILGYHFKQLTADGALTLAAESEEYYPVLYSTESKDSVIYGIDLLSNTTRRTTLERARDSGAPTVSPKVALHGIKTSGVLVLVPVYVKGTSHDTIADRRRNIDGFVVGVVELSRLMETVLSTTNLSANINLRIVDRDARNVPGPQSFSAAPKPDGAEAASLAPSWSGTLNMADASWTILSTPAAGGPLSARHDRAAMVLAGGLIVSGIVVAYVRSASHHSRRLELANRRVSELAQIDSLTGLANRRAFFDRLGVAFAAARRTGRAFAVLYFDLDHFKDVNDTLGHAVGDALLREVADRLREGVRPPDVVARFGGDEFAVLKCDAVDPSAGDSLAATIAALLAAPYDINGAVVHVTASIGIARYTPELTSPDDIMIQADLALYRAKEDGRNCCRFHSREFGEQVRERVTIADELRGAIGRGELELHYQPQVELATGRILGLEALLRWRHPSRGLIPPSLFIPIAERTGAILALGRWAFEEACRQYRAWQEEGIAPKVVAVNVSAVQFKAARDLERDIADSLRRWHIAPNHMEVELTESVLMEVSEQHGDTLERLRRLGVRIALDDFGTGYSSLSYLTTYPVNRLKIAQQLVFGVTAEPRSATVVRTAIRLAHELGIECLAEGVETEAQANFLLAAGGDQAQGFFFSRPLSRAHATLFLRERRLNPATASHAQSMPAA
jgi:diguanylate cyclase